MQTSNEQLNATRFTDQLLKFVALRLQIGGIPVENVSILWINVNVFEQVIPHERMITLRMITWNTYNYIMSLIRKNCRPFKPNN